MENFTDYGIEIPYRRTKGQVKCKCPKCSLSRTNKHDRSLSVNLDSGVWHCHYCNWSGALKEFAKITFQQKKVYVRPKEIPQANYSDKMISYLIQRGISEATAKKAKVSEGVEFIPQVGKERNTIQFRYYLDGELINIKYRDGEKNFKLCKDAELIPYNIDSIKDKDTCIITEGEFDCLSFLEAGYTSCVSVPNGASSNLSYLDDFVEGWFEDKQYIYIAVDNDTKGIELRNELVRRFGAERCKIVTFGDCKDANEMLVKYGREAVQDCVDNAKDIPISGVFTISDYEDDVNQLYLSGMPKGKTLALPNLDELVTWETSRLCVVSGYSSYGKSAFVDFICTRLALLYDWKISYFSPENMPLQYHIANLIQMITGAKFNRDNLSPEAFEEAKKYVGSHFSHILPEDGNRLEIILEKAKSEIKRKGVKALVIDPYNCIESQQGNKSETLYISEVLDSLVSFSRANDILIFLVAHPSKPEKADVKTSPSMVQVAGSIHFWNKADYGLIVHRFKGNEDENLNYTQVDVAKVKFRHLGQGGRCYFKFNINNGRYIVFDPDRPDMISRESWDNRNYLHNDITASRATAPMQITDSDTLQRIKEFEHNLDEIAPF